MRFPTDWRIEDLTPGMVIYDSHLKAIDPVTMQATDRFRKMLVVKVTDAFPGYQLVPYHGPKDGVWAPGCDPSEQVQR